MTTTRRTVLQALGALALAPMLPRTALAARGSDLVCLATKWGNDDPLDAFCAKAKKAGYDGVEHWIATKPGEQAATVATFRKHGLKFGYLLGGWDADYDAHMAQFRQQLQVALASPEPLYINCHTGRDYFSVAQNQAFFDLTHDASQRSGTPIRHETHRTRALYSAPASRPLIEADPKLRLTFDVSHWCVAAESLLADQADTVDLAIARSDHIHARVGHGQAAQVGDPRAPEWADALNAHLAWWDRIVARRRQEGAPVTMLTEFGPPPYTPTLPYTQQPVSDQWEINVWMMELFRKRYA